MNMLALTSLIQSAARQAYSKEQRSGDAIARALRRKSRQQAISTAFNGGQEGITARIRESVPDYEPPADFASDPAWTTVDAGYDLLASGRYHEFQAKLHGYVVKMTRARRRSLGLASWEADSRSDIARVSAVTVCVPEWCKDFQNDIYILETIAMIVCAACIFDPIACIECLAVTVVVAGMRMRFMSSCIVQTDPESCY